MRDQASLIGKMLPLTTKIERPTPKDGPRNTFAVHSDSQEGRIASPALIKLTATSKSGNISRDSGPSIGRIPLSDGQPSMTRQYEDI